jgi:hypothetical protein
MLGGVRSQQVVIEIVVADQQIVGDQLAVTIPETDEGLEFTINLIERQIVRCLIASAAPWSELWRQLVLKVEKIEGQRGAGQKEGTRFAARQLVFTVQPIAEPGFGGEPSSVWAKFLELVAETPAIAALEPVVAAAIKGEDLPDWRQAQALLGLTLDGIRGIGIAPVVEAGPLEAAAVLQEITIVGDDGERPIDPEA